MPATFRIYSASAGSGKTYQLTKEYLKLALGSADPAYFKHILAITFTNDAAGEMKERIVGALRRFAHGAEAEDDHLLAEVTAELAAEKQLPAHLTTEFERRREVRRRARETFRLVLYHYADFAVSTIDSFVQRIVTAFTRELGLPASFEVELDTDSVLRSAVAALLDKVNRDAQSKLLSQTLADYALGQAEQGRSWGRLADELLEFGRVLFNESVHEAVAQLGRLSLADFQRLDRAIRARREAVEARFEAVAHEARAALDAAGATAADFYQGDRGIFGYATKWAARLDPEAAPNNYVRASVEEDKWYSGKIKSAADQARVDAAKPALMTAYQQFEELRQRELPQYLLLGALQPYLFHASLLSELNKLVERISRERNVVLISEFNRRIAAIVLSEPVPFLYERLGERYRHLLIDEFQDTSVLQWNNLLPLVENAVANGGLSLAVGDAKQAIYRWRGGELEQILRLYNKQTEALAARAQDEEMRGLLEERYLTLDTALESRSLQQNFRSAAEIIGFNNDFFTYVRERHAGDELVEGIYEAGFRQTGPGDWASPPSPLSRGEGELVSSSSLGLDPRASESSGSPLSTGEGGRGGEAGHVELLFTHPDAPARRYHVPTGHYLAEPLPGYPAEAVLDYNESTCYLTVQLIEQALVDGFSLGDVAVLCRTRGQSRLLAKFLKERGYPIISADSLALQFAEVVNLLVAVFRVLHQAQDTLARAEALLLVDKVVRRAAPTPERAREIARVANDTASGRPFFDELRRLGYDVEEKETGNLGLYELAERLMRIFGLLGANAESEYLFRFLDLTLEFSLRRGNNLGNFLTYWDERKGTLSINAPAGQDAVTITTIHKAKGLAYGVVVMPFADWTLTPHKDTLLWGRVNEQLIINNEELTGSTQSKADNNQQPTTSNQQPTTKNQQPTTLNLPAVAPARLNKTLDHTALAAQAAEEREKTLLDGLNTLYVAFTRPRHRLYVVSKRPAAGGRAEPDPLDAAPPSPTGPARDVADLLHGYLRHLGRWHDEATAFPLATGTQQQTTNNKQQTTTYGLHHFATTPWADRLRLRRHATTVFDFDEAEKLGELNRKLHYALRRLVHADDLPRAVQQLVAEGLVSSKERPELETRLRAVLQDPRLAPYFAPDVAVETEREILVGGHTRRDYKPDRVVFGPGLSRATQTVTLLDFKLPPPQEAHRRRLRDYAQLFRELGYSDVRGVIYYFGSGEVVEV